MDERTGELLIGYALGSLTEEDQAAVEQRLQTQPALEGELQTLQSMVGLIAYDACEPAPVTLKARILAAAGTRREATGSKKISWNGINQSGPKGRLNGGMTWGIWGAIAALVALTLGLSWNNYVLRHRLALLDTTVAALQESKTQAFVLHGTQVAKAATGSVVLDLESGNAWVALQNLPQLPEGERYHLWAFTPEQKVLCGQFNSTSTGEVVLQIPIALLKSPRPIRFMRISREPLVNEPTARPKALVMTSESRSS